MIVTNHVVMFHGIVSAVWYFTTENTNISIDIMLCCVSNITQPTENSNIFFFLMS